MPSVNIKHNYPLKHLTWFKVGGEADILYKPINEEELRQFIHHNYHEQHLPVYVLGAGSNIIIRDGGIEGVVVKLGQGFNNIVIDQDNNCLIVGAGCLNFNLAQFCLHNGIGGYEFLTGIPGTIGGGVVMNAGCYGTEFKDIIKAIQGVDIESGEVIYLTSKELSFKHRTTIIPYNLIITKVFCKINYCKKADIKTIIDEITAKRLATQPIKEKTGGSTFMNPENNKAWQLIDQAGLRGYKLGDASISVKHCNFMINHGAASAYDLEKLGEFVRKTVYDNSGVMLEWEIKRIGRFLEQNPIYKHQ